MTPPPLDYLFRIDYCPPLLGAPRCGFYNAATNMSMDHVSLNFTLPSSYDGPLRRSPITGAGLILTSLLLRLALPLAVGTPFGP